MIPVLLCYTYPSAKTSKIDTVALRYTTWTVVRQRISKADTVALQYVFHRAEQERFSPLR